MDFFSKVGNTITTKSKDVAKKAKDIAEIASLSSQVAAKESTVNGLYTEIGKYVYENQKEGAPAEVAEKLQKIDTCVAEIEALKSQINDMKGVQACPQCGEKVDLEHAFCPKCGAKMPEKAVEEEPAEEAAEEAPAAEEAKEEE